MVMKPPKVAVMMLKFVSTMVGIVSPLLGFGMPQCTELSNSQSLNEISIRKKKHGIL